MKRSTCTTRRALMTAVVVAAAAGTITSLSNSPVLAGKKGGGGTTLTNPALVYVADDAIVTISSADGQVTQALTRSDRHFFPRRRAPAWSPNGTQIAYLEEPDQGWFDLYVMNADGSGRTLVHMFQDYNDIDRYTRLGWLNGGYIHFHGRTGPEILNLADGSIQSLGLDLIHESVGDSSIGPGVDPTVPGSQGLIAYEAFDSGVTYDFDLHLAVVTVNDDGSLSVDPATITRLDLPGAEGWPAISPDGLQVAFYDDAVWDGGSTLAVVGIDYTSGIQFGGVDTLIAGSSGEFKNSPTWSPDSEWIAFTWVHSDNPPRASGSDPYDIARIRWDGTGFTNVTNSSAHEVYVDWNPAWDPAKP